MCTPCTDGSNFADCNFLFSNTPSFALTNVSQMLRRTPYSQEQSLFKQTRIGEARLTKEL